MDRRPNIEGVPIENDETPAPVRPRKAAREDHLSNETLEDRDEVRDEGGIGYTEEGRHFDRAEKAEDGGEH
jgi:hypothetical protein